MSTYTFFVLQPYAFLAHNIHIIDINNSEYNNIKQSHADYFDSQPPAILLRGVSKGKGLIWSTAIS